MPNFVYQQGLEYVDCIRVFANGTGDLGSIPGRVIPKTQKMVLDASLLSTQHYKVRIKGKVKQSRKGVAPSPTHWCSSYWKGSLRVTLDYGRQLYLLIPCREVPHLQIGILHLMVKLLFWRVWRTLLLPLFPSPFWPGVVVPIRVSFMCQKDLFNHNNVE